MQYFFAFRAIKFYFNDLMIILVKLHLSLNFCLFQRKLWLQFDIFLKTSLA